MADRFSFVTALLRLALLMVLGVFVYEVLFVVQHATPSSLLGQFLGKKPCDQPIHYSVGTFDTRFGISQKTFQAAIAKAASVWDTAEGRQLFVYDPKHATLPINLVYDQRQQATDKLKSLGITIHNDRATYDTLKSKYDSLRAQIDKRTPALNAEISSYNTRADALSAEIASWNAKGGAPKQVYADLKARQDALQSEQQQIKADQQAVNALIDELNSVVPVLNKQAALLNLASVNYNQATAPIAGGFEEGVYESNATGTSVDIFQFDDQANLVRVLAHELGHALGMEHVTDTKAIMYYINSGGSDVPAAGDKEELGRVCGG